MFEAFNRLHHWLRVNGIDKPVVVTITTDWKTADAIGRVLCNEANELRYGASSNEPIREGQLYGIQFRIVVDDFQS
jgi:hypothetical protein